MKNTLFRASGTIHTILIGLAFALGTSTAFAGGLCKQCGGSGTCEKLVPVTTTELQTVQETCYREEQQLKVVRVPKVIQVPKEVPYKYTAWVRVKKEDVQMLEVKKPMFRWVDQKYTVNVPGIDHVVKIRKRTEQVPTVKLCTVTEDQGCWKTEMVATDTCGGCKCTEKRVWCPKLVEVTKEETVMETVCVEEPYTCEVPISVPIEKTRRVKEYFTKTTSKEVKHPYTTLEHRERTKMVTAFIPETVYEEKTEVCTVKVPYTVEKVKEVQVTKMVPQQCVCGCSE